MVPTPGGVRALGLLEQAAVRALAGAIAGIFALVAVAFVLVPSHRSVAVKLAAGPVAAGPDGAAQVYQPVSPTTLVRQPASPKPASPKRAVSAPKHGSAASARISHPAAHVAASRTAAPASGYGCGAAIAYLSAHAASGFSFVCPGYAEGHQAMTCVNTPGVCPGQHVIVINIPCAAAYKNEAFNSLLAEGLVSGRIDPFGSCP
jgi:hypothetical protein